MLKEEIQSQQMPFIWTFLAKESCCCSAKCGSPLICGSCSKDGDVVDLCELRSSSHIGTLCEVLLQLVCVNCWSEARDFARGEAKHHNMLYNVRNTPLVVNM